LWCCGDKVKKIPPLHLVEPREMHDRNMSKRLSDMRLLCRTIARICEVRGGMDVTRISTEACTLEKCM
jgi:phage FluMu protein gp41